MQGLDTTSIVPLYKQLKDLIMKEIEEGKLKPNQKIPTEQEMSKYYQISRMTVRKAMAQLVDEGVLAKKQGKGTFVQEPKITEEASVLGIRAGSPLLLVREIVYDQYDQPLHRTKSLLRGDKFKYISPRMNVIKK